VDERVIRGVPWTMLTYGANRLVNVATTMLLARLLVPADFGTFAIAVLITNFASIFSGLGLGSVLILRQDLDPRDQGTSLTLLVVAGIALGAVLTVLAGPIAAIFDEPRLERLMPWLALYLSFTGFNWFYESLLTRELAFRRRFVTQVVRNAVNSAVAVIAALAFHAGVWALVVAEAAGHVANGLACLALAPYRVGFAFDWRAARALLASGRGFVTRGFAGFLQRNVDYFTVGRVLGTTPLGYYWLAYRQADFTFYAVAEPVTRVTFPAFAQMRHRGEDIRPAYLSALRLVALATFPIAVVLSAASEPFVMTFFGPKWRGMVDALAVLGVFAAVRPFETLAGWLLGSLGEAGRAGRVAIWLLVPLVPVLVLAARLGGIVAVSVVMLGHIIVSFGVLAVQGQRYGGPRAEEQLGVLKELLVAAVIAWVPARATAVALADAPPLGALVAAALVAVAVYTAIVAVLDRGLLAYAWRQARRAVGRPARAPRPARG
jgi:O-antigen/teichoic acid export membrane protein